MNKDGFLQAVNTMKLYRRAELVDEVGAKMVADLYVDPLPSEHVLQTVLRPNTTFVIGRKGTGKSTIFQRAQESLTESRTTTWAYIDIKTLYESSTSEVVGTLPGNVTSSLPTTSIQKLIVFRNFVLELIREIKKQLELRLNSTLWNQAKDFFTGTTTELFEELDGLLADLDADKYLNITGVIQETRQDTASTKTSDKTGAHVAAKLGPTPTVEASILAELLSEIEKSRSQNYSQVFIRVFKIKELIWRLREILSALKLKHLFIFIDDFSELPKAEMEEVVDTILAPFNNWSDEFIKLKVAVYPGRLYSGAIDLSKADEVYLDIYRAYGRNDLSGMEEKAIDFTRRLILKRIEHFCDDSISTYFEDEAKDFWQTLFYACLGNPRTLGYILYYAYETNIIYDRKIGLRTIQDAARRYYEEKVSQYFKINKFLHESFEERSSIFSLKELLEEIVKRAKQLKHYKDSQVMSEFEGRPPTSHFHIIIDYDRVLSSLELNFFVTKYYEMKNRDGKEVSIYALNYGLCQQQSIIFGRPREKREHRLFLVERVFDFSPIIASYIKVNQEIVCNHCGHKHPPELLHSIQQFGMLCPECKTGTCAIVNLSRKYEQLIRDVAPENLLPETELGILKTLHDERKKMFAKDIAEELDCSYQLVGKRGRNLADRSLVKRDTDNRGKRVFQITDRATEVYFADEPSDGMEFEED